MRAEGYFMGMYLLLPGGAAVVLRQNCATDRVKAKRIAAALVLGSFLCATPLAAIQFLEQPTLVAADAVGNAQQGQSVALSADGNTAIVGGPKDNGGIGAAFVFTRSGGVWTEQVASRPAIRRQRSAEVSPRTSNRSNSASQLARKWAYV
jgi:hypothetical protein